MPFNPNSFSAGASLPVVGLPWIRDLHENLQKGMQTYNMPQQVRQEFEAKQLANALSKEQALQAQAQTPYAAQNAASNASILQNTAAYAPRMSEAEIKKLEMLGMLGGMQFPGGMGLVQGEEAAAKMYGRGSPQYKRAVAFNDALERQRLMSGTPESTRLREDNERIAQDPNIPAADKATLIALNNAKNEKNSVNAELAVMGVRAEITEMGFDELLKPEVSEALTVYSGPYGSIEYGIDQFTKTVTGKTPERLLAHRHAVTTAKNTAKNLRAAIKDSVTPTAAKDILSMLDASSFDKSPEEALAVLKATAMFFEKEKQAIDAATGKFKKKKPSAQKGFTVNESDWEFK